DDKISYYLCTWRASVYKHTLPSFKINDVISKTPTPYHVTLNFPSEIDNNHLNGTIHVDINNVKISDESFNSNLHNANYANIYIPHIKNNNVKLVMNISNSTANFRFNGTSNVDINCDRCSTTFFRTASNSADSITT